MIEESYGIIPLRSHEGVWQVFLILHRNGNHWGFPKGKSSAGEDPKTAAERELNEETGLVIERFLEHGSIDEEYHFTRRGVKVTKRVHYFFALVSGTPVLQEQEIRDGKWLSLQDAPRTLTFAGARAICQKATEILKSKGEK